MAIPVGGMGAQISSTIGSGAQFNLIYLNKISKFFKPVDGDSPPYPGITASTFRPLGHEKADAVASFLLSHSRSLILFQ